MSVAPRMRLSGFAPRKLRGLIAITSVTAGLGLAARVADAQIVRPSIGRYHGDRVDSQSAYNIEGRYLERQAMPRFEQRQTHLGWEVRGETFVVMANTSEEDAELAARAIEGSWSDTMKMADYWTEVHHQPNFSVAAISVHIDQNPRRDHQEGDLRFVDNRAHIYLNVSEGEPSVEDQLGNLRASTVHAFWRRSELDRQLPTWVRSGLASYVAAQQALAAGDTAQPTLGTNFQVYDAYWQRERIGRHELAPAPEAEAEAAIRVRYLLEGDDARHAPSFFAALAQTVQEAPAPERLGGVRGYQPNDSLEYETAVDQLCADKQQAMGEWISNPMVDQPQIVPLEEQPVVSRRQQEMAFVLKLAQRMGDFSQSRIRPKIIGGADAGKLTQSRRTMSVDQLWRDMTAADASLWATLDPHGNLLLSDQTDRLRELVEPHSGTYRSIMRDGHWAIETRLDRTTRLIAWLEENPDSPRQPLVKFERIVDQGLNQQRFQ
jgi:hypothetical protein